jgi:hypothetical protein
MFIVQQSGGSGVFNRKILRSPRMTLNSGSFRRRRIVGVLMWFGGSVFGKILWRLRGEEISEFPKL